MFGLRKQLYTLLAVAASTLALAGAVACKTAMVYAPSPSPVQFGAEQLNLAVKSVGLLPPAEGAKADISVRAYTAPTLGLLSALKSAKAKMPVKPESFAIFRKEKTISVVGSDTNGAMYGLLELAERVRMDGQSALAVRSPIIQSPTVPFRAVNPFLTLPLTEKEDWWFLSEDFWRGYLDQLAISRINWLDLHGMYDMDTTLFPNIYPYFVKSESFPLAGVSKGQAERNLAMLNRVIAWANDRGIKVALMSYSTSWNVPYAPKAPYEENEANLTNYTREVVRNLIRACPGLGMIGFRIGESGMEADFFKKSYIAGVVESGRKIPIYTRSWGAPKSKCMEIGEQFPGKLTVEIKYNGEQFGPPYQIQGGRMAGWADYSYTDYLSYPKNYDVVWQIRANGTHRVFQWANADLISRTVKTCTLAGSIGFCVEPMNAYYPMKRYFHKDANTWFTWGYQRDWLWYQMWGRLAYDPATPDKVWISQFKKRFAEAGEPAYRLVSKMSEIVPWAYTFYSMGPDHRQHAPELDTGGSLQKWADGQPFDTQNVQRPRDYVRDMLKGEPSARMTPLQAADFLDKIADETVTLLAEAKLNAPSQNQEFEDTSVDALALAHLAKYYAARLRGAVDLKWLEESGDMTRADSARQQAGIAREMWRRLTEITTKQYATFEENLRNSHLKNGYHWSVVEVELDKDEDDINKAIAKLKESPKSVAAPVVSSPEDNTGPVLKIISAKLRDVDKETKTLTVVVSAQDSSGVKSVFLKHKRLPSQIRWELTPMRKEAGNYAAELTIKAEGAMYCFEALDNNGNGTMYPDFLKETPYIVVAPWKIGAGAE